MRWLLLEFKKALSNWLFLYVCVIQKIYIPGNQPAYSSNSNKQGKTH